MADQPNILLILNDDMGYSDLGCYGGEMHTPHLDSLAAQGLRYTQFYNTARCCPSRASLLTGLYPHQADVGHMTGDDGLDGYTGDLAPNCVTIAEALKAGGYATYMSGKWHVTRHYFGPKHNWPCQRGFDDFYGIIIGAADFYQPRTLTRGNEQFDAQEEEYFITDAITEEAVRQLRQHSEQNAAAPFFQYVAYTAPHWPLHAHEEDIAATQGRFDAGWDQLRSERRERMIALGILDPAWKMSDRDPRAAPWEETPHQPWEVRRMEVYAAQIERMDRGIGEIISTLRATGQLEKTLILFLADNGGCAEELSPVLKQRIESEPIGRPVTRDGRDIQFGNDPTVMPGGPETYQSYGIPWANVSNTPFRLYKHWVHEGGISTPLIVHWPSGIQQQGELRSQPAQLPDIMATILDVANVPYPQERDGIPLQPLEGDSMRATFADQAHGREVLYWEHEGNQAVRRGKWKLVCKYPGAWELYDLEADRTESTDLILSKPQIAAELMALYNVWAERCDVTPWGELQTWRQRRAERERLASAGSTH